MATWQRIAERAEARVKELERELKLTDDLLDRRQEVLDAIPECKEHGVGCIPHAMEWIKKQKEGEVG